MKMLLAGFLKVKKLWRIMSEEEFAAGCEIDRFKPYIEIAKYAISSNIALAAVCGILIRVGVQENGIKFWPVFIFVIGIFLNVVLFMFCHRVVSAATAGITHKMSKKKRNNKLSEINSGCYSAFAILFIFSLMYWSFAIAIVAIL